MCRHELKEVALDALHVILEGFLPTSCGFVVSSHGRSLLLPATLRDNILLVATTVGVPNSIHVMRLLISPTSAEIERLTLCPVRPV